MPVTPTGFEHPSKKLETRGVVRKSGAESGALGGQTAPELAEVIAAWAALSEDVQAAIVASVRRVTSSKK